MTELHELGLVEAAAAIRQGDISAEALVETLIERSLYHADLNCFNDYNYDSARESARAADLALRSGKTFGPLHGVPITFKDNINTDMMRTTAGTLALAEHRPRRNAPVVQRLLQAGAIALAKNNMHELSFGITSNNVTFGPVRNPFDPAMIPGGSSGGTAAAVAARLTPAGIGTDTGGSIRIPASLCGVTGLRPTTGRWPQAGIVPISYTRDTPGPLARDIADLAALDAIVTGDALQLQPRRPDTMTLGIPRAHFWENLDPQVRYHCEAALVTLTDAGVRLKEVDISDLIPIDARSSFVVTLYEIHLAMAAYLEDEGLDVSFREIAEKTQSRDVHGLLEASFTKGTAICQAEYEAALHLHRPRLIRTYQAHFDRTGVDAFVFPTCPLPARPIGQDDFVELNGHQVGTFVAYMRNTGPGSNADLPGLTLPVGLTVEGLPIGLGIDAPAGRDKELLALGLALQPLLGPISRPCTKGRNDGSRLSMMIRL